MERVNEGSDAELIKRFLKGDREALSELVDRHSKTAVRIAYTVLGNEADAYDAAQDAFVKVLRNLERFSGRSSFSTWLYRIVYNAAMDIGRKRRHFVQHKVDDDSDDPDVEAEAQNMREDGKEPMEQMLRQERAKSVRKCLELLPQKYSVVIRFKDIEGLSYEEIATILGTTKGNVMSRLFYGREKLRALLEKEKI
ncbi:MAG: RNA polymerase sigma factor [Candidatus Brocadiia bacterium]